MMNSKGEKGPVVDPKPSKEEDSLITRLREIAARKPSQRAFGWFKTVD